MCHYAVTFEHEAKVSANAGHYGQPVSVCPKGGGCPSPVPPTHAVLDLTVRQQRPCCDLKSALQSDHPPLLSLPEGWPCPCRPPLVRFHRTSCQARGMSGKSYSPYYKYFSWIRPGRGGILGHRTTSTASPVGARRRLHCWNKNKRPSPVSTGKYPTYHPCLTPPPSPSGG